MTELHPDDFRVAQETFRTMFVRISHPGWRLRGVNFVTSEVLGYVAAPDGTTVEVSTGVLLHTRFFGVTYNRSNDTVPDERDGLFDTLVDAHQHIYGGSDGP